jgi:2-methylcitrate dehydratase PrpD
LAATQASGLSTWRLDTEHVQKALSFGGFPARNGVTAAAMAATGFTAAPETLEGSHNLLRAFCPDPRPDFLTDGLGSMFEIMDTSIKKYPAGQPLQSALEGLFQILTEQNLTVAEIGQIVIRLPEAQARTVNDRAMPDVNAQYLVSVALLDGRLTFEASHDFDRMRSPQVEAIKEKVFLVGDPALSRGYPAMRRAIVEVNTREGAVYRVLVDRVSGSPGNPMSFDDVADKFRGLTEGQLRTPQSEEIIAFVRDLEKQQNVAELLSLTWGSATAATRL